MSITPPKFIASSTFSSSWNTQEISNCSWSGFLCFLCFSFWGKNDACRYLHGLKPEVGEHSFFSEPSGSNRNLQMGSPIDNTWHLLPSRASSFPSSKSGDNSILQSESFFGSEFGSVTKQEGQSLRPFFDEWPKARDSWSGLEEDRSNQTSFSTTQLSISIPMASSSDFSPTSSRSPHGKLLQITLRYIH